MGGFVFVPYSARGHINPMLPVARELAAAGQRVRIVASTEFAEDIARAGADPVLVESAAPPWSPPSWGPRDLVRLAGVRRRRATALRALARRCRAEFRADRPDVVIADPMVPTTGRVAREQRIPAVWLSTTHVRRPITGQVLVNCLPELQPRRERLGPRFRFVGPLLSPATESATCLDGPVLLVSPGTVFARTEAFFRSLIDEFADTSWTVLMATGHVAPSALGELPDNIVARRWLPQRAILAQATAFLTHGGMNSVQEALAAGVPMALAPRNAEQRATTRRLERLRLGHRLRGAARPLIDHLATDRRVRNSLDTIRNRIHERDAARHAALLLQDMARRIS